MTTLKAVPDLVEVGAGEAAAALLGAALRGSEQALITLHQLSPWDLNDTSQAAVLEAIQMLCKTKFTADPTLVLGQMRADGTEVNMPAGRDAGVYIATLIEWAGVSDPRWYLKVILEHVARRHVRSAGARLTQIAGSASLDEIEARAEEELRQIGRAFERTRDAESLDYDDAREWLTPEGRAEKARIREWTDSLETTSGEVHTLTDEQRNTLAGILAGGILDPGQDAG